MNALTVCREFDNSLFRISTPGNTIANDIIKYTIHPALLKFSLTHGHDTSTCVKLDGARLRSHRFGNLLGAELATMAPVTNIHLRSHLLNSGSEFHVANMLGVTVGQIFDALAVTMPEGVLCKIDRLSRCAGVCQIGCGVDSIEWRSTFCFELHGSLYIR